MIVKIVQLPRFRAVSFHAKDSETPEEEAWAKLRSWAEPRRLFDNPTLHQVFGRNNPMPIDQPRLRGYEFWITIPDDFALEGDVSVVDFPGGLYAVVTSKGIEQMQSNWQKLIDWVQNHQEYTFGYPEGYDYPNQPSLELEHHLEPYAVGQGLSLIDYYFPIRRKSG